MRKCCEAPIFLILVPQKDWGLSAFWSSQSAKVLRGPNLFNVFVQTRCEVPNEPKEPMFLRSWRNGTKIKKIGASQHFVAPRGQKC